MKQDPPDMNQQGVQESANQGAASPGQGGAVWHGGRWKPALGVLLVLLVMLFGWKMGWFGPTPMAEAGEISITALQQDELGADPETAFLLRAQNPISAGAVKEHLKMVPEFAYDLEKNDGGREYKIIPEEKLEANTIYRLAFDPSGEQNEAFSWAFQTRGGFRITGTLPADESSGVPLNTGIEFEFSHEEFELAAAQDYFNISPQVDGKFEKHKNTLVFVPKSLQPRTVYTVTLKKGLPLIGGKESLQEDNIVKFETALDPDEPKPAFSFDLDYRSAEYSSLEAPSFAVFYNTSGSVPDLHIDLYRFHGHGAFIASIEKLDQLPGWSYWARAAYLQDVTKLSKVAGYDTRFQDVDEYSHYVNLPTPLAAGYYLAEFQAGDSVRQVWFQVSDLAVYRGLNAKNTLLWANDLKTGAAVSDMKLFLGDQELALEQKSPGLALTREDLYDSGESYALLKAGQSEIVLPLGQDDNRFMNLSTEAQNYWKYLYLDRETFQPGDPLNYWGVLATRQGRSGEVGEVTVELSSARDFYYYPPGEETPLLTSTAAIQGQTFSGQIKLPILKPGYYYLRIKDQETVILTRGFLVATYQKPSYQLTLASQKQAVFVGDKIDLTAATRFFEGTPVPGIKLNYYAGDKSGQVVTDSKGEARISLIGEVPADSYEPINYQYFSFNASLPEAGSIEAATGVLVFASNYYLTGEATANGTQLTLKTQVRGVDPDAADSGGGFEQEDFITGPVSGVKIMGALYEEIWTKTERGQRYDFISKKVVKVYDYERSEKKVSDFSLTSDGSGKAVYQGNIEEGKNYIAELKSADPQGRAARTRVYINRFDDSDYKYYYLKTPEMGQEYLPGQEVVLTLMENSHPLSVGSGKVLYIRGQAQVDHFEVSGQEEYRFSFTEEDIPNTNVQAVYFDGRIYQTAEEYSVPFAYKSRELKVSIQTDKKEYRPGDKVRLEVKVTDSAQRPVKNAALNLNLVDEAIYMLGEQDVDFPYTLYKDFVRMMLDNWKSHYRPMPGGGAEQGGEGGGERKNFRDTVLFSSLETDSDGRAAAEFVLPDNLTSWRVTYHVLASDFRAASGKEKILVRLPFFIDVNAASTYLDGDRPTVIMRAYGTGLSTGQKVDYTVALTDPQGKTTNFAAAGLAFEPLDQQLTKLEPGDYSLKVAASSGKLKDSLIRKFSVVSSLQERTVSHYVLLKDGLVLQGGTQEPTHLVFTDYEKSKYLEGLYRLIWMDGGRLEQKLAGQEASQLLTEYFPEEAALVPLQAVAPVAEFQRPDGGMAILPYASSDLELSVLVACGFADRVDERALRGYLRLKLDEEGQDRSLALLGLAALDEPVLNAIRQELNGPGVSDQSRVNLAMGLLEIGDGAEASRVFRDIVNRYGEDLGGTLRIKVGKDQDDIVLATTRAGLLAARINQPEKIKLYQYLLENPGQDLVNDLEQVQMLRPLLSQMQPGEVSFSYSLDGKKISKRLSGGESFGLTVLPRTLSTLNFTEVQGQVGVSSTYSQTFSGGGIQPSGDLKISRQYQVNAATKTSWKRSDLVKVIIYFEVGSKAPGGIYEVVDILPAGLTYVSRPYDYGIDEGAFNWWSFPSEVKGNKLVFTVGKTSGTITYYARVSAPGEYVGSAPLISSVTSPAVFAQGIPERITIQ